METLLALGFQRGKSSPCLYCHPERGLRVWIHGDDFVVQGYYDDTQWLAQQLKKCWTIVVRGVLGPKGYRDCVQELQIMNRLIEYRHDGIYWEADPRHAEIIVKEYDVGGRQVTTPATKDDAKEIEREEPLEKGAADRYRSTAARSQYLSLIHI